MNPNRIDFLIDLAYGVLIFLAIVLILSVGTAVGIAFGLGALISYIIHVGWKMARFDPEWMTREVTENIEETLTEEVTESVGEKMTEEVTESVTDEVTANVEETVTEEVTESVGETMTEEVAEEVTANVEERMTEEVAESVEETLSGEIDAVIDRLEEVNERIDERPRRDEVEERVGRVAESNGEDNGAEESNEVAE